MKMRLKNIKHSFIYAIIARELIDLNVLEMRQWASSAQSQLE